MRARDPGVERDGRVHTGLALELDTSFASRRVTRVLDAMVAERGQPKVIRCDNGPELTSRHFLAWCLERQIELVHIQPGKPTQNLHVESVHGRMREECLTVSWFQNLFDARCKIAAWRDPPHSAAARPVMRSSTRFQPYDAACKVGEKRYDFLPSKPARRTTFPSRSVPWS